MAPLSLKIVVGDGAVTRTIKFDSSTKICDAHDIVRGKILNIQPDKEYGFFLTSADDEYSGVWLEGDKTLEHYMLRTGDSLHYLSRIRNLRLRLLDGSVKTLQIDESKKIHDVLAYICAKIGISNYEEYGLCNERDKEEEAKPVTGTLTLKRNTVHREKDAQMEQLSKKLKTDDNVNWLDQNQTLRESRVDPQETLLFKRRLFYSDRNVDSRDPIQLNLLYVQTRDAILDGRQLVTEDKAAEFAGIQCHIQYGDFQEEKHKPGFIENLKEFLPTQYSGSWGVEKKIIKEHRKHQGISQLEAKYLYTKTARELPTYGVTFFLVKEKLKAKKKLVPRLLGINSESILRLDEETKEILQVWALTQVKSYRASNESFSLNFGDYSEKEYAVKTNEAFRIKDILEGYIDIIRKRLAAPYNPTFTEGEAMCEDVVELSRGTTIQTYAPQKIQEHSLVGPSQIITMEQGQMSGQGTHIVTVHEIIKRNSGMQAQQGIKGEIRLNSAMSQEFGEKLNYLNSESVKTVVLLSDPTEENIEKVRKIAQGMESALPSIVLGVKETAAKLSKKEAKTLLDDLDELCAYINNLATTAKRTDLSDPDNLMVAQDTAKKIADTSTRMFFFLDPKTRRRSKLIESSRKSFIADEKMNVSIRRGSFIAAADNACQAVEQAQEDMNEEYYNGPRPEGEDLMRLEQDAIDKMGKLNAAIALLITAHADPKNVDYEMAVNSMKAIHELVPDLIQDAKALGSVSEGDSKRDLVDQIGKLLDRTRKICMLTGTDNSEEMQDEGNKFADLSKKLIYTFRKRHPGYLGNEYADKENEIMRLTKEACEEASQLLLKTDELATVAENDPNVVALDRAGVECADASQRLLACARLTAPSIQEPHCQSALTAAVENLSSSAKNLAFVWKPIVDKPGHHIFGTQLSERTFDLAKALDRLKGAYANINDGCDLSLSQEQDEKNIERERLKFITTRAAAKRAIEDESKKLDNINDMAIDGKDQINVRDKQRELAQKLAQLNAAIAQLLQVTANRDRSDFDAAETAINTIRNIAPDIINDAKSLHGNVDEKTWNAILRDLKAMLDATSEICDNSDTSNAKDLNDAPSKFANSSGKLTYLLNPRANPQKENQILELSRLACEQTSLLLSKVYQLAESVGGEEGQNLDQAGANVVDAAQIMLTSAEITAPHIKDAHCKSALISSVDKVLDKAKVLEEIWTPLIQGSKYRENGDELKKDYCTTQAILNKIKTACQDDVGRKPAKKGVETDLLQGSKAKDIEAKRLKFVTTRSAAKRAIEEGCEKLMQKDPKSSREKIDVARKHQELSEKLAQLIAAIAELLLATTDQHHTDFSKGEPAISTILNITPDLIKDTKLLHGNINEDSWNAIMNNLKAMLDATRDICDNVDGDKAKDLNEAASKFANYSGPLTYLFNPRANSKKENEILELSKLACEQTSLMLSNVYQLAESVGGENGQNLDEAGARVVDAAQVMLKTAEITAPNMAYVRCQSAFIPAIDKVSTVAKELENIWAPLVQESKYRVIGDELDNNHTAAQILLDKLRKACQGDSSKNVINRDNRIEEQRAKDIERQKLKFVNTRLSAKHAIEEECNKLMQKETKGSNRRDKIDVDGMRQELSRKLAQLNAAIALLLQATADRDHPDFTAAETAINTILNITPEITKEAKSLDGHIREDQWNAIMKDLTEMLHATRDMCDLADGNNAEGLNEATSKFANSSGELTYLVNPQANAKKENEILELSRLACEQTSLMLSKVYYLAESVGGENGQNLDEAGAKVVDAAQVMLKSAEITAPNMSDERCQSAFMPAVEKVSAVVEDLGKIWTPLVQEPKYREIGDVIKKDHNEVQNLLDKLRNSCKDATNKEQEAIEKQRLKFITTRTAAKNKLKDESKKLLDTGKKKPNIEQKIDVREQQRDISQKLAQLNAAIAYLLQNTADRDHPNFIEAETAMSTICNITPEIIKDSKSLRGNIDENSWNSIMKDLKDMLDATSDICDYSEGDKAKLKEATSKFANSSGKLTYSFNSRTNPKKEDKIIELSKLASEQTSLMLNKAYQLAKKVKGDNGQHLGQAIAKVVDATQVMLSSAEITAPNIKEAHCQSALISAIDNLSAKAKSLENICTPLVQESEYRPIGEQIKKDHTNAQNLLDKLKKACSDETDTRPDYKNLTKTRENINGLEKLLDGALVSSPDTEFKPKDTSEVDSSSSQKRRLLCQKLAQLNEAIAQLVHAVSDRGNPNQKAVDDAMSAMSNLTPAIVQDTINLGKTTGDLRLLVEEAKELCKASQEICTCVENDSIEELNEAAAKYAKSAGKLRYIVSPRTNQNKGNQILEIARTACERTSLMLSRVSRLAESIGQDGGAKLESAGFKVADAARVLLTNAQITAPFIKDGHCGQSLISSAEKMAAVSSGLEKTWKPMLYNNEYTAIGDQLRKDQESLQNELNKLINVCMIDKTQLHTLEEEALANLDNDHMQRVEGSVKDKIKLQKEVLVFEDTPLKQMAMKILASTQMKAESSNCSPEEKNAYAKFCNDLADAIKDLDRTNAKCRNKPLDLNRRQELENAILILQQMCLFSRNKGDHNNIVDLANYIDDVTAGIGELTKTVDEKKSDCKEYGTVIKNICQNINADAEKVLVLSEQGEESDIIDDTLKIDQFAKNCEDGVKKIDKTISIVRDGPTKSELQKKLQSLTECSELLSFAAKCSLSSTMSIPLDESLRNLNAIETNIEAILKPSDTSPSAIAQNGNAVAANTAKEALTSAVATNPEDVANALAHYALQMRKIQYSGDPTRVRKHLQKLLELLKSQITAKSRRVATWQDPYDGEVTAITENIIQELQNFQEDLQSQVKPKGNAKNTIQLKNNDYMNLLVPKRAAIPYDKTQFENIFQKQIQKLNSIAGMVTMSLHRPDSLSKTLHTTSEAAVYLAALARSFDTQDLIQKKRIEEATQGMSVATYNLLKMSELACRTPKRSDSRRKLQEACKALNDTLNKLARTVFPAQKTQREFDEMCRSLQTQAAFLQADRPSCALSYTDCVDALQNQRDVIYKLNCENVMSPTERCEALRFINTAVCNSAEYATQTAYLLSLSNENRHYAEHGLVDVAHIQKLTSSIQDNCLKIMTITDKEQVIEMGTKVDKQVQQLKKVLDEAAVKSKDNKTVFAEHSRELQLAHTVLNEVITHLPLHKDEEVTQKTLQVIDVVMKIDSTVSAIDQPIAENNSKSMAETKDVTDTARNLINTTSTLVKKVKDSGNKTMTWVMFGSTDVIKTFDDLVACIKQKGVLAGVVKASIQEEAPVKSFIQTQVDFANKWLQRPACKPNDRDAGVRGINEVIKLAEKIIEDLNDTEKEEMNQVVTETKDLLHTCVQKYNSEKASLLMERLKELRKMLEREVVTRVVEDFLEDDIHIDLDAVIEKENDAGKRKFLLEKKIAELLAQLGKVTRTVRFVADTGFGKARQDLLDSSNQVELLAPSLVKAAQHRIASPEDQAAIDKYKALLDEYAQSLARMREFCDRAVDPIDFAQAAGETMHRLKENISTLHDPHQRAITSKFMRLGNRVVEVGMNSPEVTSDPEVMKTLTNIKRCLAGTKHSGEQRPDWRDVTAEILRKTGEVEAVLGGENIFSRQRNPDQPIFAAAHDLHAAVREWSARDNDIVAAAKRMAVLMARLSDHMNTDNKRQLILTSKSIVSAASEVAALARKLALECTDIRIRTNLLQVCDRISTISGQLKMLTTVKGSSMGHQGSAEDREAMTMLVGNAQNLMTSVQEVIKAAASASVKIMSQSGHRMKWVRRNYYY